MNGESANKFITALVKSLQTLCHGYVEFHDGIEIIGHLYLNIDSGSTFDYVLKEKVCKNAENSTVFVSKSFHAQAQAEDILIRKEKDTDLSPGNDHEAGLEGSGMSPTGTTRLQSAITNISNVLAGSENQKGRLEHMSHSPSPHNTGKRKREHNGSYSNLQPPYKYTTLQSTSSAMPYFNNSSKQSSAASRDHSDFNNASQSNEFFGADSNQSSGMGPDDEEDLDLDVTFVKEEYGDRGQRGGQAAASRVSQDPSSSQSSLLHDNSPGGSYPMGYPTPQSQQFTGPSDVGSMGQSFHDGSQIDVGQQNIQAVPNPRSNSSGKSHTFQVPAVPTKYFRCHVCGIIIRHKNNIKRHMRKHNASHGLRDILSSPVSPNDTTFGLGSLPQAAVTKKNDLIHTIRQNKWAVTRARDDASAGPPHRMPEGVKPLCGYVHPEDAKKWMMYDLLPGSGVFIHQENYNVVMSKTRQDRPDGKAMARYLMSCFWRQSELVGASIAEPPKPHQRSLDRGIIHAILGFCQHHSRELATDIRRTIQQKIGYAKFYFVKKTNDPDSPKTPAAISAEASPRRMSMEMARRSATGLPLDTPLVRMPSRRGRRSSEILSRGLAMEMPGLISSRASEELPNRAASSMGEAVTSRSSGEENSGRMSTPASSNLSGLGRISEGMTDRLSSDKPAWLSEIACRTAGDPPSSRGSVEPHNRLPADLSSRLSADLSSRMTSESIGRMLPDEMASRMSEGAATELANRLSSSVTGGMSRGFLDMLNNMYPNN